MDSSKAVLLRVLNEAKKSISEAEQLIGQDAPLAEDHVRRIQVQYSQLLNSITCIFDIVTELFQQRNLTEMEMEDLTDSPPLKACEKLLKLIMIKPRDVYESFLESLKNTQQHHVYQMLTYAAIDIDQRCTCITEHSRVIRHRFCLLNETISPEPLLDHLFQMKVLTCNEYEAISSRTGVSKINEALLLLISRKSSEQFAKFNEALNDTNQVHVVRMLEADQEEIRKKESDLNNNTIRLLGSIKNTTAGINPQPSTESTGNMNKTSSDKKSRSISAFLAKLKEIEERLQVDVSLKVTSLDDGISNSRNNIRSICLKRVLQESYNLRRRMEDNDNTVLINQQLRTIIDQMQLELNSVNTKLIEETRLKQEAESEGKRQKEEICQFQRKIKSLEQELREAQNEIAKLKTPAKDRPTESEQNEPVRETEPETNREGLSHLKDRNGDGETQSNPPSLNREIQNLAIFNGGLYANHHRYRKSPIEIYDAKTFKFIQKWTTDYLHFIEHLETSKDGKYLIILSLRSFSPTVHDIIQVDGSQNIINKWETTNFNWKSFSLAHDSNVVLYTTSVICEYSLEGNILTRIELASKNIGYLVQCMKISRYRYLARFGEHSRKKVAILEVAGKDLSIAEIKSLQSFAGPVGWLAKRLHDAADLAVDKQGLIYVADENNNRVLIFNSELQQIGEVFLGVQSLLKPRRLLLDESNDRMFVIDSTGIIVCQGLTLRQKLGFDFKPIGLLST